MFGVLGMRLLETSVYGIFKLPEPWPRPRNLKLLIAPSAEMKRMEFVSMAGTPVRCAVGNSVLDMAFLIEEPKIITR